MKKAVSVFVCTANRFPTSRPFQVTPFDFMLVPSQVRKELKKKKALTLVTLQCPFISQTPVTVKVAVHDCEKCYSVKWRWLSCYPSFQEVEQSECSH